MDTQVLVRGNLPAELTSFVGRRGELADAKRLLAEARLVTLTGVGGVGKTRLALRVAGQSGQAFVDGVWLIDLATLREPSLVAQRVAASMGLRDDSGKWSVTLLTDYLADRQVLLLWDNCEHLLDACAVLVETLLRAAPGLRILTTSRQPLGSPGERVVTVLPLAVPDADLAPASPEWLSRYDAVALFVDRACAGSASFSVTADNMSAVARLVKRLDGIPLAVELAAARVRVLSPQQILNRLEAGNRLLSSSSRTSLPHQRSLEALIDWSFELCTDAERVLWARLSVFPRDFEVEAAEQICSDDGLALDAVLDALVGLVDKSVLVAERVGQQVRYRLPETLREYGLIRLGDSGGVVLFRRRHCQYFGQLARRAWQEWFGPAQLEWTSWMKREHVNLRAALELSLVESGESLAGHSVVPALSIYWLVSGSLEEGRRLIDHALGVEQGPTHERALLLCLSAWLAINQGDPAVAEAAARESVELSQEDPDRRTFGHASSLLGAISMFRGQPVAAEPWYQQSFDAAGSAGLIGARALLGLAAVARAAGDRALQVTRLRRCVALCEEKGESWERAAALWALSMMSWEQGDRAQATELARDSLRLRAAFPDQLGIAKCLELLAAIAAAGSQHERSGVLLGAAQAMVRSVGAVLAPDLAQVHADCEATIRRALGERGFAAVTRQGAGLVLDDLVAYALADRPTVKPPSAEISVLTKREQEIADLVAAGLSNREIAAKMVISQRTAEGHIEHILTKLGFSSRTQIAAWVAARQAGNTG
jgi:non-specific serine/threonine protein kinase